MRGGRISNVDLEDKVNLTPGPCLRRVQRLEESVTILGYHAVVDPAALGRTFELILDVDLNANTSCPAGDQKVASRFTMKTVNPKRET